MAALYIARREISTFTVDRARDSIVQMRRTTCYFSGTVQGVGFRYTAMNIAQGYDITGYVRNMGDGRVELVVEGSDDDRKGLIQEIHDRMGDYITEVKSSESAATGEFQRFSVRH